MAPLAVLALALAAVALGAAAVAGTQAWRGVRRLRAAVDTARDRLTPLVTELQGELAVLSTEAEAMSASVAELSAPQLPRRPVPRGEKRRGRPSGASRRGARRRR